MNDNNFDFLRVFFALNIFAGHIITLIPEVSDYYFKFFPFVRYSVNSFFVISGFLITKSYYNSDNLKTFFIKRVKRIFPAYFVVIILSVLLLSFVSELSLREYFTNFQTLRYFLANSIFQNYLGPCLPGVFEENVLCAVNGALWTIKIEEGFYFSLPIIIFLMSYFKKNKLFYFLLIYLLSIVFITFFKYHNMDRIARQLPGAMVYLISGVIFYHFFNSLLKYKHIIFAIMLMLFILEKSFLNYIILTPFAISYMVFYAAFAFPVLKKFGKYGDFTYGIYIYHFPLIQLVVSLNLLKKYPKEIVLPILVITVISLGILSWYLIESKFIKRRHISSS